MLRIAICDDESYMLTQLHTKISEYLRQCNMDGHLIDFASGISLLCSSQSFDIIVMDIKMSGMDGMETMRRLRTKDNYSQVIFVTSSKDYVFQAFDVDAVHYLMKPVADQDLFQALYKAVQRLGQVEKQAITITKGRSVQIIPFCNILYCESIDHKIYICTAVTKEDYYGKLDDLQKQLDDRFFRCHRSYIVNLSFVSSKEQDMVTMTNGDQILLSRRKQKLFSERLLSYIRGEALPC